MKNKAIAFSIGFWVFLLTLSTVKAEESSLFTFAFADGAERVYEDNGLVFVKAGIAPSFAIGPISVTPSLSFVFEVDETTEDELIVGVALGYSY